VGCSRERTLVARRENTGDLSLVKIFEQGSLQEARQEMDLARALARVVGQPGLVRYRQATEDPVTGKPCVMMEFCAGEDLARHVSARGPLTATAASMVTLRVARVLQAMHEARLPQAPYGVIHRDVKPANVVLNAQPTADSDKPEITIIDLEHAVARRAPGPSGEPPSSVGFRGGTHGYSPPEAYLGAHPDPAFDVFGLGATLHFILTGVGVFRGHDANTLSGSVRVGARRNGLLHGTHPTLKNLVANCLEPDANARPTMAAVVAQLEEVLAAKQPTDRELDRVLKLARAAEFAEAERLLDTTTARDSNRGRELRQLIQHLSRLHSRLGGMPQCESELSTEPLDLQSTAEQIAGTLPRLIAFLERFPSHEAARASCRLLQSTAHRLLETVPPQVTALKQQAAFDDASRLLETTMTAVAASVRMSGPAPNTAAKTQGHLPSPLYRDPLGFLRRNRESVANLQRAHEKLLARLAQSEARLDLRQAGQVLVEVVAIYSGASRVTAELKDRLHHFDYYLANIARPRPQLRELAAELELAELPQHLEVVVEFQQLCAQRTIVGQEESGARGKGGCRGLRRALRDLAYEFPHAAKAAQPAMDALVGALQSLTSMAWDLVDAARLKLEATPLPVRPVQSLVNKLDRLRLLKAFVDQEDRSRADLLEEIEWVRMRLDQARTARDQLARGAQESEQKGHLTTALYEMGRAVDSFTADMDADQDGPSLEQLRSRYQELKHKKERLERATVDNRRLAAWYVELQDREDSQFTDRVQALEQRAEILELLLANLDEERAPPYAADLREVQIHLVQEHSDEGERRLDAAATAQARLEIAESSIDNLQRWALEAGAGSDFSHDADRDFGRDPAGGGGRVGRILDHWVSRVDRARQALREEQEAAIRGARHRRRAMFMRYAAGVVVLVGAFAVYQEVWGGEKPTAMANLLESLDKTKLTSHELRRVKGKVYYPRLQACVELQSFVGRLEDAEPDPLGGDVVTAARKVVDELNQLAEAPAGVPCLEWVPRVRARLKDYMAAIETRQKNIYTYQVGPMVRARLDEFGRVAHLTGISLAATLPDARVLTFENVLRRQEGLGVAAIGAGDIDRVLKVLR